MTEERPVKEGEVVEDTEAPTDTAQSDDAQGDDAGRHAPDGAADPEDEARLEAEVARLEEQLARARADYHNLQRRVERDAALERERVKGRVLEGFLQVYEYGKMAEFEAQRNPGPLAEGVKMIVREFDRMLEREGVRPIGEVGEAYDVGRHEAHTTEPAEGVPPGHVSRVIQQGYELGDRVLRHAKVAVAPDEEE